MLALAQALVTKPKFILADELSFGLAPLILAWLMSEIEEVAKSGVGVLLIEQLTRIAFQVSERAYVQDRRAIPFEGASAEIIATPSILHGSYLAGEFNAEAPHHA